MKVEAIQREAARGGFWLAGFRFISQSISWVSTIIVARILVPEDFGVMEMATILTGYVSLFAELGLGSAIIQREDITDEELSSLFWFMVFWGIILGFVCVILAYPTVAIFNERRLLRVTQSASVLCVIGGFVIVPLTILNREIKFKTLGGIDAICTIVSCVMIIILAKLGAGVWALVGGLIIRGGLGAVLIYFLSSWRPSFHFNYKRIRPYLKYGLNVFGANSLYYIYSKSDRFFAGRALGSNALGHYSLALELASVPSGKIVSLINSVSFPVFSRYQKDSSDFNQFYLRLVNLISSIAFPIYIGGIFVADQLIPIILGSKWVAMIFPFKLLCVAQLLISFTTPNALANMAQGRPHWSLYMGIVNVAVMPISFYIASKYGLNGISVPWITIYPVLILIFLLITMRKLGISSFQYLEALRHPVLGTIGMAFTILLVQYVCSMNTDRMFVDSGFYLFVSITAGLISYGGYYFFFQRSLLSTLLNLRHTRE